MGLGLHRARVRIRVRARVRVRVRAILTLPLANLLQAPEKVEAAGRGHGAHGEPRDLTLQRGLARLQRR